MQCKHASKLFSVKVLLLNALDMCLGDLQECTGVVTGWFQMRTLNHKRKVISGSRKYLVQHTLGVNTAHKQR
jgi:hypothetical protein